MIKQRRLGQHFLNSNTVAKSIVSNAQITPNDTVFEVGTGYGILTSLLCEVSKEVISIDIDKTIVDNNKKRFANIKNLTLDCGDGFAIPRDFTIFVSNLPYSYSREAIEWLSLQNFSHGVIMVQDEFAQKLLDKTSRAISVIANYCFDIDICMRVSRTNFTPQPKVDSVVMRVQKLHTLNKPMIRAINSIFAYRRKTVKSIMRQFGISSTIESRIDDLSKEEIIELGHQIVK